MSTITRTPKKLSQSALSSSATAYYTTPSFTETQITEIWLKNNNITTTRTVTVYAHGLTDSNILFTLSISANGSALISNSRIVLATTEVLGAKIDTGTDVIMTTYGIEEVTS